MAASTTTTSPTQAFKTLTISRAEAGSLCHLLSLPREVRDGIYEYVLVEPRRWDKRHQSGCALADSHEIGPRPPFATAAIWPNDADWPSALQRAPRQEKPRTVAADAQRCARTCLRRVGRGLLNVNKQIHREASEVFWKGNTFCFDDLDAFVATFQALPQEAAALVRRVSIMALRGRRWYGVDRWEHLRHVLLSMRSLELLEIPHEHLFGINHDLMDMRQLKVLRLLSLRTIRTDFDGIPGLVYASLLICFEIKWRDYRLAGQIWRQMMDLDGARINYMRWFERV